MCETYVTLSNYELMKRERVFRSADLLADTNLIVQSAKDIIRFGKTTSEFLDRVDLAYLSLLLQYDSALKKFDK